MLSKTYMLDIYTIPHFQLPCLKILSLTSFTPFWRLDNRYNFCTKPASDPAYIAENVLNREFKSDKPDEKWLTDVSEFKYGTGGDEKRGKIYLSVILDLCGRRPVAFEYSDHNDNSLVFNTFDKALTANPGATPLFHSDYAQFLIIRIEATSILPKSSARR